MVLHSRQSPGTYDGEDSLMGNKVPGNLKAFPCLGSSHRKQKIDPYDQEEIRAGRLLSGPQDTYSLGIFSMPGDISEWAATLV